MALRSDHLSRCPRWLLLSAAVLFAAMTLSGTFSAGDPADSEVVGRVRELLSLVLNVAVPSDDTDIVEAGLLDSLALVELLVAIEQEFKVQIDLEHLDLENLRSVRSIARTVCQATGIRPEGLEPPVAGHQGDR